MFSLVLDWVTVKAVAAVALVVRLPADKPTAVPVTLVIVPEAGVPKAGVTSVGLVFNTTEPVPVEEVTPVPPDATGSAEPRVRVAI
jgi:hypothetical protein